MITYEASYGPEPHDPEFPTRCLVGVHRDAPAQTHVEAMITLIEKASFSLNDIHGAMLEHLEEQGALNA